MAATVFHFPSGGKYTKETAFFNISRFLSSDSYAWFWIGKTLRLRPEILCISSLICAVAGSIAILHGAWWWAVLWIHLTDSLDCADGTLARYSGLATRFGRFLDVLIDGFGVTALVVAISIQVSRSTSVANAVLAGTVLWLFLFIECSMMNFSNLQYARCVGSYGVNSRQDERFTDADRRTPLYERIAHSCYLVIFGWQDQICLRLHSFMTHTLSPHAEQIYCTTKIFVTLHTLFSFRVSLATIAVLAAVSSIHTAVSLWLVISAITFSTLLAAKWVTIQQLRTTHTIPKHADEKPTHLS